MNTPTALISLEFTDLVSKIRSAILNGPNGKTFTLVGTAIVLWASWPALAVVAHPAPPFLVLGLSALVGFLLSFLLSVRRNKTRQFFSVRLITLAFVAFGLMGNNAFYLAAITRLGPAEANVVHYLWPVFLFALSAMLSKRIPTFIQTVGIASGFISVAIALSPQMSLGFDFTGLLLGVCGALTFAIYSVVRSLAKVELDVVGPSLGLAGLAALAAHLFIETFYLPSVSQWVAIILMGIGPFTLANVCWDKATREGSAATISSLAFLTPLVALSLLAFFGLGDVNITSLIGALCAIGGAILCNAKFGNGNP